METLETVTEIASQVLPLEDCINLFVSCIAVGFLLAGIPFLLGLGIHVMIRIFSKASYPGKENNMETVVTALTNSLTTVGTDVIGAVEKVVPAALPIVAVGIVVPVVIKIFKRVAH